VDAGGRPRFFVHRIFRLIERKPWVAMAVVAGLSLALHGYVLPRDLIGIHVWRQTETQTVIQSFAREDFNLLNPRVNELAHPDRIFRMEVPVMQWLFAAVCRAMPGPDYFWSRLLTLLVGFCTVAGMYKLGRAVFRSKRAALVAAWAFNWSPVFFYYTVAPLPDNAALCCAVWSLVFALRAARSGGARHAWWCAFWLGLAVAIKLPYAVFGAAPLVVWLHAWRRDGAKALRWSLPTAVVVCLIPAAAWYAWVIPHWDGNGVVAGILGAKESGAEMLRILASHLVSTGPELLLNYGALLFFAVGCWKFCARRLWRAPVFPSLAGVAMAVLAYYIFELPLIGTVHDYYLFPFLPLLFLAVGFGAEAVLEARSRPVRWIGIAALCVLPITAFLRIHNRWNTAEPGFHATFYHEKETLRKIIPPGTRVAVGPDDSRRILLYYLDRHGYTFRAQPSADDLLFWKAQGVRYLATLSPLPEDARTSKILAVDTPLFSDSTLRVYAFR